MFLASRYGTVSSTGAAELALLVTSSAGAAISYDGTNWSYTAYPTSVGNDAYGTIIGEEGLVVAGATTSEVRFSTDGTSWSALDIFPSFAISASGKGDYHDGTYAWAAGWTYFSASPVFFYSTNPGVSWSQDAPGGSNGYATAVFWDGSRWILSCSIASPYAIQYKTTLGTGSWTSVTTPFSSAGQVAYDGTTYIATVRGTSIYYSTNLTSWTGVYVAGVNFDQIATNGSGTWLITQTNTSGIYRSTNNGLSWSLSYTAPAINRGLTYSSQLGKFVVSSNSGNIRTSTDGITWTTVNVGTGATLYGIYGA